MQLQAVIFDFDGVLADSERLHLRAFREVLGEAGVTLSETDYYTKYLGLVDADVIRSAARDRSQSLAPGQLEEMLARKAARYRSLIAGTPVLYPGVQERLREWSRHVPLAIASGALRAEIDAILAAADRTLAGCFTTIVSAEDVVRGKPAPDGYLLALRRLREHRAEAPCRNHPTSDAARGFSPANIVVIEDSPFGLQAAKAAGMRTVAVTTNHGVDRLAGADLVVPSVAALDLQTLRGLVARPC